MSQGPSQKGMYRVRGEDAITKWPRAMESVIQDRDTYMTAGIKAIAMGGPLAGCSGSCWHAAWALKPEHLCILLAAYMAGLFREDCGSLLC